MPRVICATCHYPAKTCLCDFITPVNHHTSLLFLQHPSEVNNAKNTLKLIKLMSDNTQVYVGESELDFDGVKQRVLTQKNDYALLFPSDQAIDIKEIEKNTEVKLKTLIVLDGTWKKAKKILLLNPWLQQIPHIKCNEQLPGNYKIRATKIAGALSTIEAAALTLRHLESIDISPMLNALDGLNQKFTQHMPEKVKQRY